MATLSCLDFHLTFFMEGQMLTWSLPGWSLSSWCGLPGHPPKGRAAFMTCLHPLGPGEQREKCTRPCHYGLVEDFIVPNPP